MSDPDRAERRRRDVIIMGWAIFYLALIGAVLAYLFVDTAHGFAS